MQSGPCVGSGTGGPLEIASYVRFPDRLIQRHDARGQQLRTAMIDARNRLGDYRTSGASGSARCGFSALAGFGGPTSRPRLRPYWKARSNVDLVDTADCYGPNLSEEMIAETLYPYREGLVIATKGGLTCPQRGSWIPSAAPDQLRRCCVHSLQRLRLEQIELYQLHAVDPDVKFEQSIEAIAELQQEGLVRRVGLCNVSADTESERARRMEAGRWLPCRTGDSSWTAPMTMWSTCAPPRGSCSWHGSRSSAAR